MRLRIYNDLNKPEEQFIKMMEINGKITLLAVNEDGEAIERGKILELSDDGIYLYPNVNLITGIKLDFVGKCKVVENQF